MAEEIALNNITPETCFVPATHKGKGRRTAVAPGATAARYLHYGRITLGADDAPISFQNNDHETGLICLNGAAKVSSAGETFELSRYDAVYIPRDSNIEVQANGAEGCDLAEVSAPVSQRYPVKFVSYSEVRQESQAASDRRQTTGRTRPERLDWSECGCRSDHGRRHLLHTGQLDLLASARAFAHA